MSVLSLGAPPRLGERVGAVAGALQVEGSLVHRIELTAGPVEPPPLRFAFHAR